MNYRGKERRQRAAFERMTSRFTTFEDWQNHLKTEREKREADCERASQPFSFQSPEEERMDAQYAYDIDLNFEAEQNAALLPSP